METSQSLAVVEGLECSETNTALSKDTIEGGPLLLHHKLSQLSLSTSSREPTFDCSESPDSPLDAEDVATMPDNDDEALRSSTPLRNISTPSEGNSPSTSQVSVGSIPPTLTAALLMRKHYDLTPIMRNTHTITGTTGTNSTSTTANQRRDHSIVISPDDYENEDSSDFLHGEHLSLPSDLLAPDSNDGPALPPLMSRATVAATTVGCSLEDYARPQELRKFYSFTSRQQYEEALLERRENDPNLVPYQPSRDQVLDDYGRIPETELASIFIPKIRRPEESHANHRLSNPILMEERTWSIPSLRMANHLNGSATTTEDEESLLYFNDDASLSSRGSLDTDLGRAASFPLFDHDHHHHHPDVGSSERRNKRKQIRQDALEWLHSVEADGVVEEAASSKFLMAGNFATAAPGREPLTIRPRTTTTSLPRRDSTPSL